MTVKELSNIVPDNTTVNLVGLNWDGYVYSGTAKEVRNCDYANRVVKECYPEQDYDYEEEEGPKITFTTYASLSLVIGDSNG